MSTTDTLPNMLVVMADQMTPFLLGAYGCRGAMTPNLAALAARGTRFTNAYTPSPICVPARAAFMTGLQVSSLGCYDNGDPFPGFVPTFAHYLANAGYDTALAGKMHFIGADQLHGFRRRLNTDVYPAGFIWSYPLPDDDPQAVAFDFVRQYRAENIGAGWSTELQYDEETHFRALEYLRQPPGRPFALTVSYTNPHPPYKVPPRYWQMYAEADLPLPEYPADMDERYSEFDRALIRWHGLDRASIRDPVHLRAMRRGYAALAHYVDDKLGELLAVLDERGLRDSTMVVFTADHGEMLGEKGLIQKRSFYEWSSRIPLIIARPDASPRVVETPVSLLDLPATLIDAAGATPVQPLDGRSLLPAVEGASFAEQPIISEYHGEGIMRPCFMVRRGAWKYHYTHRAPPRLYNLAEDPGEWHDRSGEPALAGIERELDQLVTGGRFDLGFIERDVWARLPQKQVVNTAMNANRTSWDYRPEFDPSSQYVRS